MICTRKHQPNEKLGVIINRKLELRGLTLNYDPLLRNKGGTILRNVCKMCLELDLMKLHKKSDYSMENSGESAIEHAPLDALVSSKVAKISKKNWYTLIPIL